MPHFSKMSPIWNFPDLPNHEWNKMHIYNPKCWGCLSHRNKKPNDAWVLNDGHGDYFVCYWIYAFLFVTGNILNSPIWKEIFVQNSQHMWGCKNWSWLTKTDSVDGWNDVTPGSKWQEKASLCWRRYSQGSSVGFPSSSLISMRWKQHRGGERWGNFPTHGPTKATLQFFSVWITWAGRL